MPYTIRQARREDWREFRELRLAALRDPVARVAFFEPYEEAAELPRGEWERRSSGKDTVTFAGLADDEGGAWAGMVSTFLQRGRVRVVGVYLCPEHRGTGLAGDLMRTAVSWGGRREVRLHVHEHNKRAARFYESFGFRPTGHCERDPHDPALRAFELALRPGRRALSGGR